MQDLGRTCVGMCVSAFMSVCVRALKPLAQSHGGFV